MFPIHFSADLKMFIYMSKHNVGTNYLKCWCVIMESLMDFRKHKINL